MLYTYSILSILGSKSRDSVSPLYIYTPDYNRTVLSVLIRVSSPSPCFTQFGMGASKLKNGKFVTF
ncbi:hypothetical protein BC826DRAFT_322389 [Russula brevipes]|nr:hypothetical protein BC826DRAFT_322389 [Russula brevipes]